MISLFRRFLATAPAINSIDFNDRGVFTQAYNDQFFPDHPVVQRRHQLETERQTAKTELTAARLERDTQRIARAYAFLRSGFDRLAEEQTRGMKHAKVGDYTAERVQEFEQMLSLANRLLVRQSDTAYGTTATDAALEECGYSALRFRFDHKC